MGNSEGSLSRKGSKHGNDDLDRRSSGSHKGTPKKKGIMKESLSRSHIYERERSPNAKQNSPIHSQQHEQSGILANSKESSPYKTETSNKANKNKTRNEEKTNLGKSTEMKKLSNDSEEEKELHERSRSPRSPERSQTPKSYERSESPRSPMRNVDQSDEDSNVSLSQSDDDDDSKLRKHNNHLPSFIKPENKVLPTVVPVKPLHQTEFGAILQQGGSITRKKHQEQKEAELKRLEMLYEQARLQDYSMREQYWSMPNIPPADYDIPPPDYDDISDYEKDIKKSKKKSKSNQKDRNRNSFYSSPVRDQSEGQYAWDSETEWYIESKSEKKKKKENKGKKGISLIHRTESVNESLSPKKDKKKKSSKRSISLGPGESSLRDKWKNADWLRIKKKESKGIDENIASKKKNPIRKSNDVDTDEWRNPNNPYTADVHHYNDEKQVAYYEKSFSKQSERGRHNSEYYKSENQKNVKSRSKRIPELETVESSIEKDNDHLWRQKEEQNNPSHKNQTESDSDNYQKKSASGFSERIFLTRYSPQKVDAATSTSLDDVKHPPPRKKGRKKNSVMQDENLDWSNSHHKRQSPSKHNKEETYGKKMSSDEEILQKQRFHRSSGDVRNSPEYKSKDFTLSRSSHDLYQEEDNSIMTEVKHSFENVISEMNYGSNDKKQEVMFGTTQSAQAGSKKTEKISSAVKSLKERNEHLQEEKIKEIRARSPSPIEMHLRPTVPKREFKMPPNFSPNQTWKNFTAQTSDNEGQQNYSNEDIRENKIEKIVNPSVPARHPKAIVPRIEKETSSSSDGDVDLYQGFDKQYSSKNQNWTPNQDLLDDIEPEVKYRKPSPVAHPPQTHLSMPSSMFPPNQNYSRSPISRVSPRQEDSSDSSSKRNSISRIKESVKHAVGLKNKNTSTHHLDANWSLVKSNSSEDERDYREFSRNEQREKYMFGESTGNKNRNASSFSSNNGHIVYLPGYQRPASVDLFEKKTHRVARAYSFQSPERMEAKQRFVDHVSRQAEEREHQREVEKARIQKVEEEFRRQREKQQLREKFPLSRSDADVHQLSHDEAKRNYYNWNDTKHYKEMNTNISENRKKNSYGKNNENKLEITSSKYYRHDNFKNNDEEERRQWKSVDNLGYTSPLQNISPDNRVQSLWRERMRVKSPSPERGLKRSQSQRISQDNDHQDSRKWTQGSERVLQRSHSQRLAEPRETLFGDNYSSDRLHNNPSKANSRYLGQTHQSNSPSYFYNKGNKVYRAQSEIAINRDYQKEKWFEDARGRDRQRNRADQRYRANDRTYDNPRYGSESQHYSSSKDEFGRYSNGKEFRRGMSTSASDLLSNNSRSTFWKRHQESRRADI